MQNKQTKYVEKSTKQFGVETRDRVESEGSQAPPLVTSATERRRKVVRCQSRVRYTSVQFSGTWCTVVQVKVQQSAELDVNRCRDAFLGYCHARLLMGLYPPDKSHDGDDVENGYELQGSLSTFDNCTLTEHHTCAGQIHICKFNHVGQVIKR